MLWYEWHFFGMHFFWWLFWVALGVGAFALMTPVSRKVVRLYREDALGILQRRYAGGLLTTDEYEERKTRIERDLNDAKLRPLSQPPTR